MNNDDPQDKLVRARLNLADSEEIKEWEKDLDYLEKKKREARLSMESLAQRQKREEAEKAAKEKEESLKQRELDLEKQKELEKKRKEEEEKRREEAAKKAEAERLARLEEVIKEKEKIKDLKNRPAAELTPLKTFEGDVASTIRKENLSSARILIKERENKPLVIDETPQIYKPRNFISLVLIFSLLLGLTGAGTYLWWQKKKTDQVKSITAFVHKSLIFADESREISLDTKQSAQIAEEIKMTLTSSAREPGTTGYLKEIYFTNSTSTTLEEKTLTFKEEVDFQTWVRSLKLNLPDEFSRFVEGPFMFGNYMGESQGHFFVLKTKNYANLADALLKQETRIVPILFSLFLSPEEVGKVAFQGFRDKIYRNLDLRVSKDETNQPLAVWAFLDPETLVIAQTEEILGRIIDAYLSNKN